MKKLLTLSLCSLLLWSCTKDSEVVAPSDPTMSVTFTSEISTRVDALGFETDDVISVAAYSGTTALSTNTLYEYDGYIFNSEVPIEYQSSEQELTFTAVYPAQTSSSIMSFDFEIAADQTVDDAYELSDLLVSVSEPTTERQPELLFNHVMSNVVINIISDESFDDAVLKLQAVNNATCNLSAKTYVAKGNSTTITAAKNAEIGLKAIVAPQTITANTTFATLAVGERVYEWTILEDMIFESGRQYSFNWDLAINEVAPTGIINGWGDSTSEAGTDIAYTRLKDYSATSYPADAETWVIYDVYANTDNFDGVQAALNAISGSTLDDREIYIEFPNLLNVPENALYSSSSSNSTTKSTCLKRISLPQVTQIGNSAFYSCAALESVETPELLSIESSAFYGCSALSSIDLSKVIFIGSSAFASCTSMLSLTAESIVHVGESAFLNLTNLISISLPEAVTLGTNAFSGCSNLMYIDIPNVTTIYGNTFGNCSSLVSISIPKFTTFDHYHTSYVPFSGCSNLRYISIATESTIESCRSLFGGLSTEFITLTIGRSNSAYVEDNTFTALDKDGATTDYTFYEIIIAD